VLQFEIPTLGAASGVGLIWSGAFTALYYKFPGGSLTVSDGLCPTTTRDVAAPTGLHFTPQLLSQLQERGIGSAFVTLHVGWERFDRLQVGTLRLTKCMEVGRGFRRNGGANSPNPKRVRSDYCGGHNSGTSFGSGS